MHTAEFWIAVLTVSWIVATLLHAVSIGLCFSFLYHINLVVNYQTDVQVGRQSITLYIYIAHHLLIINIIFFILALLCFHESLQIIIILLNFRKLEFHFICIRSSGTDCPVL